MQRVRRHRPSELLPAIAAKNIEAAPDGLWNTNTGGPFFPWALAVAARESVRAGNEHRVPGVTDRDLAEICVLYHNLYDPILDDGDGLACLVRIAFEQFPFQEPLFFATARSRLLFEQVSAEAAARLRIVSPQFWQDLLGWPLETLLNAGLLLGVGALRNGGAFDLAWYTQSNFQAISPAVPQAVTASLLRTTFAADVQTLKAMYPAPYSAGYERVTFNPLQARPFIDQPGQRYLAPVPQFVFWRASASGLYYIALEQLNSGDRSTFTDDVGTLFEDYVLRQAAQLPLEQCLAAIEYERGSHTTDAILVWPNFIVLVEAKATRLTQESRMGGAALRGDLERTVSHAFEQLDETAALIRDRHPSLAHVPSDRPIYGLVVTLEPYHFVNAPFARAELSINPPSNPVAVASIQDFERFVADVLAEGLGANEVAALVDPADVGAWGIEALLQAKSVKAHRNPLLDVEFQKVSAFGAKLGEGPGGESHA